MVADADVPPMLMDDARPRVPTEKVAGSAGLLALRRAGLAVLSAVATAVVAHRLGVAAFGAYSAGLAAFYLLQSACDFGFGTVLTRELATRPQHRRSLFRSTVLVATVWSILIAVGLGVLAITAGIGSPRGLTMAALIVPLSLTGASVSRQVFLVDYEVATLARIDVISNVAQAGGLIGLAALDVPPWLLATWVGTTTAGGTLWAAELARRRVKDQDVTPSVAREIVRLAAPLGLVSFLASAYFMLDITIDGYLVSSGRLAQYAAAVKVLNIVVSLPALVLGAALPAMSTQSRDESGMSMLAARLWHWMTVTVIPLTVGLFVFAPLVIRVLFGSAYMEAVPLLRILLGSAGVAILSAVLGNVLVARRRAGAMLAQNSVALVGNVLGNVLLVPHVGVIASAWLTLGTEVFVCSMSVLLLRRSLQFERFASESWRGGIAVCAIALGLLVPQPLLAVVVGAAGFLVVSIVLRAWPREFPVLRRFST